MLGLFGTLDLGSRSLQTQRAGVEVAGHNLANVNNPAYARQRVAIQTATAVDTALGPQGTGAEATRITQLRSDILDRQILGEQSVSGWLTSQQSALQLAQSNLGQQINRTAGAGDASGQTGLGDSLNQLFSAFQGVATNPTSLPDRQALVAAAADLASKFNQIDQRLGATRGLLNQSVQSDVTSANELLNNIARLNQQIAASEASGNGTANDLRDLRQQSIEELSKIVNVSVSTEANGLLDVSVGGTTLVTGASVAETLEAYDPGDGGLMVRAQSTGTALRVSGGTLGGTIDVRDGALADLRTQVNSLASTLITTVNDAHAAGFALDGSSGRAFFTGTNASDIAVNGSLMDDPSLVQASGDATAAGDNTVALNLAHLADNANAALGGQTFTQKYGAIVQTLGHAAASINSQVSEQDAVNSMLLRQRDSVSGVSIDEEMTDLTRFQKAFEASARLITTVDEMLDTLVNMKR